MKGRVYVEYRRLGFFAVETEDNDFSIIEVRSGIPSLGEAKSYIKDAARGK